MWPAAALGAKKLALACAEAVLLIDYREAEVGQLHRFFYQGVSADDEGAVA
jgi:hypothetical protein